MKLDEIDLGEFEQGIESPFWQTIRGYLQEVRARKVADCCSLSATERTADQCRGAIDMLDMILGTSARDPLTKVIIEDSEKEKRREKTSRF